MGNGEQRNVGMREDKGREEEEGREGGREGGREEPISEKRSGITLNRSS